MPDKNKVAQDAETNPEMEAAMKVFNDLGQRDAFPNNRFLRHVSADNLIIGYSFDLSNPWYTGRTVSSVAVLGVVINGFAIDPRHVSIIVREQKIPANVAKTMHEIWWGFGEAAQIYIEKEGLKDTTVKNSNKVEVKLGMSSPSGQLVDFVLHREMEVN